MSKMKLNKPNKLTKSNQFKLCRNKICADTRSIKVNNQFKSRKTIDRNLYFF